MTPVCVTLVALSLAEVAVVPCGVGRVELPHLWLDDDWNQSEGLAWLLRDSGIVNHASPKLVTVLDHPSGGVDIVYRVRTSSRALDPDYQWQHVDTVTGAHTRKALAAALTAERP